MAFRVKVTRSAEGQIEAAYVWFREGDVGFADQWFRQLMVVGEMLRCPS